ncbi:hypothetical protein GGI20_005868 [Coemansia sp. BCRC 34301]|nr:hypothetical protein GGI20_005868 [Coemansia sp. BCRC 34301]
MIPSIYLSVSRSLGRALGLNVENPAKYKGKTSFTSFAGSAESEVLQIDDITNLRRSVSEMAGFIPILNRDVARMTYSLLAAQLQSRQQQPHSASALPLRRYYDASESRSAITPGPASGGDDGNDDKPGLYAGSAGNHDPRADSTCSAGVGNDNETDAANANDGPDARYRRALHLLWHGYPVSGAVINESHILKYLHSAANKSVGNALVSLKQSLQLYPRSERLWDLYLELFARQPVPAQEVIAAFHDATKFNPGSTFLWQRYMHWCNWNIVHGVNSLGDCSLWLSRLSTLSLAAVKGHVDMQQYPLAEQASASLAKIIVCFWEGLWTLLGLHITWSSRSGVVLKPAVLKAQLISQMVACLWARTPAELCNLLSDAGASGVSHDLSSSTGQSSLDCSELALGRLLLPHHFLYVGQVFLHCFIAGSFVPQSVLAQMHTTLSTDPRRPITTHRLSLRKITQLLPAARELDGSLKPHISGVIRRFYTSIQAILGSYSLAESADLQNSAVARSLAICHASMNLTLAELEQCPPAKTLTLTHGREDLLYRISKDPLDSLDIKGLPEQIVGQGIDTFAMVTRIMSKCDLAHNNYVSCEVAVHILREHALLVAKKLGVAPSTSMPTPWPVSNVMSTPNVIKRLRRRIADCRILYYRILGHTGPEQPKSMDALGLGLVNIPRDESVNYSRLLANAGIWINVAMIEFLVARFSSSSLSVSVDVQAIDSALFWLNYGLKTHVVDSGARAQLQAIILQVTTVKRPLSVKDIVRVHRDLGYADNSDTLHLLRMNLAPINAVLRPLLLTASSETLEAIRGYLHYVGYANTELALR